jgi:acyl-CoA dehydrogenase
VLALTNGDGIRVAVCNPADLSITKGHNGGGEPRDVVIAPSAAFVTVEGAAAELARRGAWARCMQVVGALDAAVEFSVAHTREREQFGRSLSAFQVVQHSLAAMAGDVERARAAANLAVAAASDHGFDSPQADYAVTVAKVTLGRVVPAVVTSAHQLHAAIGVTIEHRLWLATQRARSWIGEFGDTAHHARHLGRLALAADDPWDLMIGAASGSDA